MQSRIQAAGLGEVSSVGAWIDAQNSAMRSGNDQFLLALTGLGGLYALISAIAAAPMGISQRARELALARLGGLTRAQATRIGIAESVVAAAIGIGLGTMVAAVQMLSAIRALGLSSAQTIGAVPWALWGGIVLLALACLAPGRRRWPVESRPGPGPSPWPPPGSEGSQPDPPMSTSYPS